jgi:hypothetical protein
MKKILAVLIMLMSFSCCFAEFMLGCDGKTYTGYIVNCLAQTIEKVTLPYGANLDKLGRFFYVEDGVIYDVVTQPDTWHKDKVTGRGVTTWARHECEEESMQKVIISFAERVQKNNKDWDLSDLFNKVKNMDFED